ncbi:MAG: hypothetical protein ACI85L_001979 [Pseudomonadota bacterium]|jgi:hypothetical protein
MLLRVLNPLLFAVAWTYVLCDIVERHNNLIVFYQSIRVYITTAVGSAALILALFTLAFTLFLKRVVYDTDTYKLRYEEMNKLQMTNAGMPLDGIYNPLKNVFTYLMITSCLLLIATVTQLTVGFIEHDHAVLFSLTVCMYAVLSLIDALFICAQNVNDALSSEND